MSLAKMAWLCPLVVALPVLAVGCRGNPASATSRTTADLQEIHEMYQLAAKRQQKPPHQLSDLTKKDFEVIYPSAVRGLKQGKYVVVWDVQGEQSGTVLAYEKDAPAKGGAVLMADGTVKDMTAEELKAAQKS
jgi:hypothetical protein